MGAANISPLDKLYKL
jgi:hypothetical protein